MHTPQNFTLNGIAYATISAYTVEVTSEGIYEGDIKIPHSIIYESETYTVTSIGEHAFKDCKGLNSISIPNCVCTIEEWAFSDCINLKDISIPNSVTNIGRYAFSSCENLSTITIPYSVISIGDGAFSGCNNLNNIDVSKLNPSYKNKDGVLFNKTMDTLVAFPNGKNADKYEIPISVKRIGESAFAGCVSLKTIIIPNSVKYIDDNAFSDCTDLKKIIIPDSLIRIGEMAFVNCINLSTFTIPKSVTSIGDSAFYGCKSLTTITIPELVTDLGYGVFNDCDNLTNLVVSDSNPIYTCKDGVLFDKTMGVLITFFTGKISSNYIIPDSVYKIDDSAFAYCKKLYSVTFSNSVTCIGESAFIGCLNLSNIIISNSIVRIGALAFGNCESLKTITIPKSVTSIGRLAFYYCYSLEELHCNSDKPIHLENISTLNDLFYNNNKTTCVLYVPKGSKEAYRSAKLWQEFENIVEEEI
jgi:hypothetical protein